MNIIRHLRKDKWAVIVMDKEPKLSAQHYSNLWNEAYAGSFIVGTIKDKEKNGNK